MRACTSILVPALAALALSAGTGSATAAARFVRPVDAPAVLTPLAKFSPVLATARAGRRVVAVGQRGHILLSDDAGANWRQAKVPVSVDLTAVSFPTDRQGWAVGHDGVVLHTSDGGESWQRQLGGNQAIKHALDYYSSRPGLLGDEQSGLLSSLAADPRGQPFLGVHFKSADSGYVVGTFGLIFRTDDGGATWTPWSDRMDNSDQLNLVAVEGRAGQIYVVGERGKVWRLDPGASRFESVATPYEGTLFGAVAGDAGMVIAYGMRGAAFRSADGGHGWEKLDLGTSAGITSGVALEDGRIALADQGGSLFLGAADGSGFREVPQPHAMPVFAVSSVLGRQGLVAGGALGMTHLDTRSGN